MANGPMIRQPRPTRRHVLLASAVLTCLIGGVFWPIVHFEFLDYDVPGQVIQNPYIRGISGENLKGIFTERGNGGPTDSYYPVRTLSYAVDWQLWGLEAGGFKTTNGFIHLLNTLLVFWLVLRLFRHPEATAGTTAWWDTLVATFSAGLFAVHPVVVESVVWVSCREELLMTLGALGCLHFHITARQLAAEGGSPRTALACHAAAALCCLAACLSNVIGAVIPLLIVVWDVLTLAGPKLKRILYGTSALWVIGVVAIVLKKLLEFDPALKHAADLALVIGQLGYAIEGGAVRAAIDEIAKTSIPIVVDEVGAISVERVAIVLNLCWLNIKTLLWPTKLAVVYSPVAPGGFADAGVMAGAIAVALTSAVLWTLRRRKLIVFGLLWFAVALAPASQIMPHHIHRADRFLYLPLVGLAVAWAMSLRPLRSALGGRVTAVTIALMGVAALMIVVSFGQIQTWRNRLSVWEKSVAVSPGSLMAHRGLAENLALYGRSAEAVEHCRIAVRLNPRLMEGMNAFVFNLAGSDTAESGDYELAIRMAELICQMTQRNEKKYWRTLAAVHGRLAACLSNRGKFNSAADHYLNAMEAAEEAQDAAMVSELSSRLSACRRAGSDRSGPRTTEPSGNSP